MRRVIKSFSYLVVLLILLSAVNMIPRNWIQGNLAESIEWYRSDTDGLYLIEGYSFSKTHYNSDSAELNIMANADSDSPLESAILPPMYLEEGKSYLTLGYETIINGAEANADYNRYWHGYQVLWKPLFIFFGTVGVRVVALVAYVALIFALFWLCWVRGYRCLGLGLCALNALYIVPCGFVSLSYITIFFVAMIGCLLLIRGNR